MSGPPGAHLGKKLADIQAEARKVSGEHLLVQEQALRRQHAEAFMDEFVDFAMPRLQELLGPAVMAMGTPDILHELAGIGLDIEHGVGGFFLGLAAVLGIALGGAGAAASGALMQLRNFSNRDQGFLALTPEQAAEGILKGAIDTPTAITHARYAGMQENTLAALVGLTGDPPGPQQLLEAERRGYIDAARLEHGIRQSRIKDEWIDVIQKLRYAPPGAAEVIHAEVQNHLDRAAALQKMSEAGIDPANHDWLYETAGRPPGIQELVQLWRRGATDQATVEQAVRESDIKDKYIPAILQFKKHVLPQRTVVSGVRQGVLDDARALELFREEGIEGADAQMLLAEGHSTRTTAAREASAGQVLTFYRDGILSRSDAGARLAQLRYDVTSTEELLTDVDAHVLHAQVSAAVTRVRSFYVAHKITEPEASLLLDQIGTDSGQRDRMIQLWGLERAANVRLLTEAQIVKAIKANVLTYQEGLAKHLAIGYTEEDARLLLAADGITG